MMDITGKTAIVTGAAPGIGGDGQSCPLTGHPQQYRELAGWGGERSFAERAPDGKDAPKPDLLSVARVQLGSTLSGASKSTRARALTLRRAGQA